ncbi:MAG: alpha-glucuronidase family glycosyl hydrolase, partial [Armatimonadota bacterium]
MKRLINAQILATSIILLISSSYLSASESTVIQLMASRPVAADNKAVVKFHLPKTPMSSAKLKLTAYNGDPERRLTPELYINGVGGKIAYTVADNIADGFIPSKQTRTWTFDLSKKYGILTKRGTPSGKNPSYVPIQDSEKILDTNFMEILSRSGEHTLSCWIDAPGSKVSAELIVEHKRLTGGRSMNALQNIQADTINDIRIKLCVNKLRKIAGQLQFSHIKFIIGKNITEPIIGKPDLSDLGNEGFYIKSIKKSDKLIIIVTGNDNQGIAYGVFRLARIMLSSPDQLTSLNLRMKPALAIREMYEEHGWANPRDISSYKLLLNRYFEESINTMDLPVGWFISPDYYLKGASSKDKENLETVKKVIEYAHSLGIKVYIVEDAYLNPLYNEKPENIANIDPAKLSDIQCLMQSGSRESLLLCLANPISRDLIKRNREYLYRYFTDADGLVIYFGDPGGCYHKECLPHGEKIIKYMNEIYVPLFKETNPEMKVIVTLWGIGLEDTEYVVKHLSELPKNVIAIQIPPTNMRAGDYLTFEPRRGDLIREAGISLPVIIQQF